MDLDIRRSVAQSRFGTNAGLLLLFSAMPGWIAAQTVISAPTAQSFGQIAVSGGTTPTQVIGYVVSGTTNPVFSLSYGTEYSLAATSCTGSGNITCTISISFQPHLPGLRQDAVLVKDKSGNVIATTSFYGVGLGPLAGLYPGVISTIAGTGAWGYAGDGGLSTAATLANPQGVAIDNLGNLYIADSINQGVREISATSGRISTVAGSGKPGYTGDGGPAAKATLNNPTAVALDGAGNLYVADQGNNVIRKVSAATGRIATVAGGGTAASGPDGLGDGGLATNALLNGPNDIAVDGAGNLYIADSFNGVIRQVQASSGNITVVAAGLHNPTGVAVDTAGNLYIADTGDSVIRRVDASSGKVAIVAGNGGYGYGGDQGPAISAKLGSPVCVRLDPAGNLYIADQGDNVVRQVNAQSGIITTIAGTGAPGYFGDGGIPTAAALRNPTGVALDSAGNLYIADYTNNLIRKISPASILAFPNTPVGEASAPQQLTVLNIGNQPLSLSGLAVSSNFGQEPVGGAICSSSSVLASAASCTVVIDFSPTISGNLSGQLTLTDNSRSFTGTIQSMVLTGTGIVGAVPQLSLSPSTLSFAAQAVGTSGSAQSITLSNPGTAALNLSSIQLGGANGGDFGITTTCLNVLAAKGTCSISIIFSPSATGTRTASLTLVDNLANSPQTIIITGTGGTPQIAFSSSALAFGRQPVGTTSPANTITIANTGSATLNIVSMAMSGANGTDFSLTSTCGASLAVGANCSVSVSFVPSAIGPRSALLTLANNSTNSPESVTFKGTGEPANVAASATASHYYAGSDSHVHELYISGGAWHDSDLTVAAGGPNVALGSSIVNVMDTISNVLRINYTGSDAHVHELYTSGGNWHDYDLTAATGGPKIAGGTSIANVVDTISNMLRIDCLGIDAHIHELYIAGGAWHDIDLTAAAGGPKIATGSSITTVVDTIANLLRIHYAGVDSHVHELYVSSGVWYDYDLTAATGGPKIAAGASIANVVDTLANMLRIHYTAADSHAHEFYISQGAWHDYDLTAAAGGPNVASGGSIVNIVDTTADLLRINYTAADSHMHELYPYGGAWHDCDLTAAAGGPKIAGGASIVNIIDGTADLLRINYTGGDSHVHELYPYGGAWHDCDLTAAAATP